jgi:hypothetical protein
LSANYDPAIRACRLFADDGDGPMKPLEVTLPPKAIIAVTRILATPDRHSLQPSAAFLNCLLANGFGYHARCRQSLMGLAFRSDVGRRSRQSWSQCSSAFSREV